jgi:hypothetical protein
VDVSLLERAGEIKAELVKFAESGRFEKEREAFIREQLEGTGGADATVTALDRFTLSWKDRDSRSIIDLFLAERTDLPDADRAMVSGWSDVIESLFEVDRHDGAALIAVNLVNDVEHRIYSNRGIRYTARIDDGALIHTRIVPLGGGWMLSGSTHVYDNRNRDKIYRLALQIASASPSMVFRNPANLARAWDLQERDREEFVKFFGSELVILRREEIAERMRAYLRFKTYESRDEEGLTRAERAEEEERPIPPLPDPNLEEYPEDAKDVGFLYDATEGQLVFYNLGTVQAAFDDPAMLNDPDVLELVREYITDPELSPLPLCRFAEGDPAKATQVVRRVMGEATFEWKRDADALMRKYKAAYIDQTHLPSVIPVSERLTNPRPGPGGERLAPPPGKKIGRNEPCPCGSGKKYKVCCGR